MKKDISHQIKESFFTDNKNFQSFNAMFKEALTPPKSIQLKQIDGINILVYTPQLAAILSEPEIPVRDIENKTDIVISGKEYQQSYTESFLKGVIFFDKNFSVSPDILYGDKSHNYINTLIQNYNHSGHDSKIKGWNFVKKNHTDILNHSLIEEYGYYAGIVSKVDNLRKEHSVLFSEYDKAVKDKHGESRPGYSIADPLYNYRKLKWAFEAYFKNIDMHINNGDRIVKFSYELYYDNEIYNVAHRALIEIQDLVLTPNNNADRLLKEAFDESNLLFNESENIIKKSEEIFMDVPKHQYFYSNRQVIVNFNWEIRILISKGNSQAFGEPYVDKIISEAIAKGLRPPMPEYYQFRNSKMADQKQENEKSASSINNVISPINQAMAELLEPDFGAEAKAKGLKPGTAKYYNFINSRKGELEDEKAEEKRIKDYEYLVGQDTILCPTIKEFGQLIGIQKMNPDKYKYGVWLWDEKVKYTNARRYYTSWGARGTGIDRGDTYEKILAWIQEEIELCKATPQKSIDIAVLQSNQPQQDNTIPPTGEANRKREEPLKTLAELDSSEGLYWDGIPIKKLIAHFKVMTEKNSKNGKPFLTEKQLLHFVLKAFTDKSDLPQQSINLANGEKGFVIKRFYELFDFAVTQYSVINKKDKYIKLLANNFTNWEYDKIVPFF